MIDQPVFEQIHVLMHLPLLIVAHVQASISVTCSDEQSNASFHPAHLPFISGRMMMLSNRSYRAHVRLNIVCFSAEKTHFLLYSLSRPVFIHSNSIRSTDNRDLPLASCSSSASRRIILSLGLASVNESIVSNRVGFAATACDSLFGFSRVYLSG